MSFTSYASYKAYTGLWSESLPSHWETASLKWISTIYAGGTPDKKNTSFWEGGTVPWINSGAVNQRTIRNPSAYITEEALANSSTRMVPKGAVIVALAGQGKTKGMVAHLDIDAACNQSMAAIIAAKNIETRYLYWWLISNYQNIRNLAGGDLRDGLNLEHLGGIGTPLPPDSEQTQIARFLDHETARIDALIEEQQRLIELLKEKRQAVISHAVTKGLDPNVPMKESGVEWLGKVPEHWKVGPLGYYSQIDTGATPDRSNSEYWNGDIPWVKTGEVNYEPITSTDEHITLEGVRNSAVRIAPPGTMLMAMYGQGVTRGRVAILAIDAAYNQACAAINTGNGLTVTFLRWYMVAAYPYIRDDGNETSQMNLSASYIGKISVAVPPTKEQAEVSSYLEDITRRYETLIEEAKRSERLLLERRSALISAAVTGKIDVRNWQPAQPNATDTDDYAMVAEPAAEYS